jgi:hypothetical protein
MVDVISVDTNTLTTAICARIKAARPSCPFDQAKMRLGVRREKGLYTVSWSYGQTGFIPVTIDESMCTNNGGAASVAIAKVTAAMVDAFDRVLIVDVTRGRVRVTKTIVSGDEDADDDE